MLSSRSSVTPSYRPRPPPPRSDPPLWPGGLVSRPRPARPPWPASEPGAADRTASTRRSRTPTSTWPRPRPGRLPSLPKRTGYRSPRLTGGSRRRGGAGSCRPAAPARRGEAPGEATGYPDAVPIDASLRSRVRDLVASYLDGQQFPEDLTAEPVAIRAGTAVVYVRLIDAEPPVVRVFSPLLRHIPRSPELLGELNDLNARLNFLRLFWRDETVYAANELLAANLDVHAFANACASLAETADYYDVRLHARFGGETAYAERRPA